MDTLGIIWQHLIFYKVILALDFEERILSLSNIIILIELSTFRDAPESIQSNIIMTSFGHGLIKFYNLKH